MHVMLTGSTGLIGSALTPFLRAGGHQVRRLRREPSADSDTTHWSPTDGTLADGALDGIDAVVHLAGESIASGRWTTARKARIRDSRVDGTRRLCEALAGLESPPKVLVAASALGYYGDRGNELLDESALPGTGFLSAVCQDWEAAAAPARERGIRVVHLRTGIVLSPLGGALGQMLLPFRLGLGGVVGSGDQFMSWISPDDMLAITLRALADDQISGPVSGPGHHRGPWAKWRRTRSLALGEMADALLLSSTRVDPAVLRAAGFEFAHPNLEDALRHVLGAA